MAFVKSDLDNKINSIDSLIVMKSLSEEDDKLLKDNWDFIKELLLDISAVLEDYETRITALEP